MIAAYICWGISGTSIVLMFAVILLSRRKDLSKTQDEVIREWFED
jgi:hypothetical protein